jgi:hypothetical protein
MALEMGEYMSTLKIAAPYSQVNSDNSQQGPFSFKGIVQRDLTGVESRLKRSALINYLVALVLFFKFKVTLLREK